jgi:hypothetical protein
MDQLIEILPELLKDPLPFRRSFIRGVVLQFERRHTKSFDIIETRGLLWWRNNNQRTPECGFGHA